MPTLAAWTRWAESPVSVQLEVLNLNCLRVMQVVCFCGRVYAAVNTICFLHFRGTG